MCTGDPYYIQSHYNCVISGPRGAYDGLVWPLWSGRAQGHGETVCTPLYYIIHVPEDNQHTIYTQH